VLRTMGISVKVRGEEGSHRTKMIGLSVEGIPSDDNGRGVLGVLRGCGLHHRPRAFKGEPAAAWHGAGAEHPAAASIADRDGHRVPAAAAGYHSDHAQQSQVGV
jgi:hypothetical protein